jgi:hypothetical protein
MLCALMYFWDTLRGVLYVHWNFLGMNNILLITYTKIIQPNEGIAFLLGFGRVMQYPSNCRKIWYGAQTISRIPRMGYCMFIEYFALWTWMQHELNVSKLNWSSVSFWLSTWFAIPRWKTLFEQNLQYPYIRGVKYFNHPHIYFVWMNKGKLHAIPSFYLFFIIVDHWGSIGVATM